MMGAGLFPLLIYVVSSWALLGGPGPASTLAAAAVTSVEDFIVLNSACYYESDYVNDNLRLRDLVAASDVIIKAFAGDGNYLRPGLVASGREPTTNGPGGGGGGREQSENHRLNGGRRNHTVSDGFAPEQEHGNEENGNASSISEADFVLRLEPTIVYKGNEVYKKLKLINWQHYVVIKSMASSSSSSKLRRSPTTTTPSSSAQSATNYISSRSRSKCNRTRLITRNINNSSHSSSGTTEVHAESRTFNSSSSSRTTTTTAMQDNKLSRSKETGSNTTSNKSIEAGNTAENNTRELLTVASVFSELLPTELIIFGRLDDTGNLQVDLFSGLLHWDEELQNAIWRELGWSDWSEYTPCSVSCGKGVQQRFRHCLKSPQAGHEDDTHHSGASRTMSSTRRVTPTAAAFRQPYVNIEQQHPRKDGGGGVMNNENVNPSSLFTTPLTASTRDCGGTVKPTVAFTTTTQEEEDEEDAFFSGEDDEEQEAERDEDEDANPGAEPPAGRDTPVSTADLQPAIERHFNESTNANSGERSIRRRRRLHRLGGILQQYQKHHPSERRGGGKKHITAADSGVTGFCEGYNIEQRSCNMFECTGSLDLLAASDGHQSTGGGPWDNQFNFHISQMKSNFTLLLNLRSRKWHHRPPTNQPNSGQHPAPMSSPTTPTPNTIVSLRSQLAAASSLSINFANDGHGGLKVIQEKFGLSEMLPVERNLLDGKWHSVALSGRSGGGYIAVYIDCRWANSFVLSRGAIELPQYPVIEAGHDIELGQLTLVPGDTAVRLQCGTDTIPITDIENRQVTSYFEGIN